MGKRTGRPNGRPPGSSPLLTPEVTQAICVQLELAVPEKYASEMNGVDEDTFHGWMRKGAAGIEPYTGFRQAVSRARAKCIGNMHVRALSGGKGSSAALWMLERRFWREYAQHQRVELSTPDPLQIMPEDEVEAKLVEQRKLVAQYERAKKLLEKG